MPTSLETLASYVPALIVRKSVSQLAHLDVPVRESFPGAILFADISGFTAITKHLAQRGPSGAEEIARHLNTYFGQLIALLAAHGGDVIKFAGDALLALWPATDEDLATVTRRAAQCSLAILTELHDYVADADVHLTLHIGIAAGETMGLRVGGVQGRWEFLVAGAPLVQMASAAAHAKKGEVCISPEGWTLIKDNYSGTILESGNVRLHTCEKPLPPRQALVPELVPEMVPALRCYVPPGILERLDAGQSQWLDELRCVTVLFVGLLELDYAVVGVLEQLQQAMQVMQKVVYRYEGTIRQLIIDDKGSVLIAAFGLPPFAHEDDAVRGVQAALAIRDSLRNLGWATAIGITTGRVYCGSVGSETRCEYAMVGDIVNLAARLMMAAQEEVLCDEATYHATQRYLSFEICSPIQIKGKAESVVIYRPRPQTQLTYRQQMPIVGRMAERTLLAEKLDCLRKDGVGGVVVIEGQPGIGKSRLVQDLIERALSLSVTSLRGSGDAIEKSTSYYAWRKVFSQLLDLGILSDRSQRLSYPVGTPIVYGEAARRHVLDQLESGTEWVHLAPLLNAVLPLNFPKNEFTSQLTGQVRADNTHNLLVHLIQASAEKSPKLLVLEDAHWLDSASWALTRLIASQKMPLLLVIATRPIIETTPEDYLQLLHLPGTLHIQIEALSNEDSLALVCQRLGVTSLPEPMAALICKKAQGNPFFSEELAYALRDVGLITIANGQCQLATDVEKFNEFFVPDNIRSLITSRLDRLTPMQQLTLKVGSAIGRVFAFRLLKCVYPIEEDKVHLADYLDALERLDFTPLETSDPDLAYIFKHVITQEVAYNLMLFSQRRQLHYAVAQWYEQNHADDLSSFYPVLAHHWSHAVEPGQGWSVPVSKAIDYLEKAGEQALQSHSLREAVRFFSEALTLDSAESLSPHTTWLRQARWERQLGAAYLGLGQLPESREHLTKALTLLTRPMPTTRASFLASLLGQVWRQAMHRLGYICLQRDSPEANAALLETAMVYDQLAEIYYHANEIVAAIYAALNTLNLAERAGPSPTLARAYANSCFAAGMIPLHSLAETYSRMARSIALRVEQPMLVKARVLIVTGAYSIGVGQWGQVQEAIGAQAVEICARLGDWHEWGNCMAILAKAAYFQGEFDRGVELWAEAYTVAHRHGDILQQAWGLNGQAEGLLRLGRADKAVSLLTAALLLFAENRDRVSETATYGMLAVARLQQGEQQLAKETAEATQERLRQLSSPSSYYLIEGYAGVTEVYLALWQTSSNQFSMELEALKKSARLACKALHQFARVFPIGQPRAWLCQGLYDWLAGHPARASKAWRRSLAAAEQLAMPYEQGLARYQIGQEISPRST